MTADGKRLVVSDMQRGELAVFSLGGQLDKRVERPGLGALEFDRPFRIARDGAGFLLLDGNEHLLELDGALVPRQGWILPHSEDLGQGLPFQGERGKVAEVFLWEAVGSDASLVARGDVRDAKGWRSGVFRFTRRAPFRVSQLAEIPAFPDTHYLYYLNLKPTLATLGDAIYELRFAARPEVRRLAPEPRSWPAPKPLDLQLPLLAGLGGREGQPQLYAKLRTLPMQAGLYAWQGGLYLVSWQPGSAGDLRWSLWRLDLERGWRGPMSLDLPPEVVSVVVAPGPQSWALLLSGQLTAPEQQAFLGVKLLPAESIRKALE
ncbi:MAG TPA: hypothetical protein VGV61_12150 [Thermoanaerobaculia bacterium]|jgi:hypothetical protein|nr:hypothetical protein [Thermoanaerobaculia bacterium]